MHKRMNPARTTAQTSARATTRMTWAATAALAAWFLAATVHVPVAYGAPDGGSGPGQGQQPAQAQQQPATQPAAAQPAGGDPADVALAARLSDLAQSMLRQKVVVAAHWKMAAALLEGANRLDPDEARYPRLMAEALLKVHDNDGAIRALKLCRTANPDDRLVQARLIDLYAARFQTVDAQLDYLRRIAVEKSLPDEVRSYAACRAAMAFLERAQRREAELLIKEALKLNPVNLEALRFYYDNFIADGTPLERVSVLLSMLKANPAQLGVMQRLAEETADLGLPQPSVWFYSQGAALAARAGTPYTREFAAAYAVEEEMLNQPQFVAQLADQLLSANGSDFEALILKLLSQRAGEQKDTRDAKDALTKTHQRAENILVNRLQMVRKALGDTTATTRPVSEVTPVSWGNLSEDVKRLNTAIGRASTRPAAAPGIDPAPAPDEQSRGGANPLEPLRTEYVATLVDLAWYEIYFREQPNDARSIMDALKDLLPADDPALVRLEGWTFLVNGQKDQARVKLSAVADRDALAELGMVRLTSPEDPKTAAAAQKLLNAHPTGLLGAVIHDGLRPYKTQLAPPQATVAPVLEELGKFPGGWLAILEQPQNFYVLRMDPVKVAHPYGEPILVRITLQNVSDYPITIDEEGTLRPDLWFDAQLRASAIQDLTGCAFDRLSGLLVLKPRDGISQIVRVDQGDLGRLLAENPLPPIQVMLFVRTNPASGSTLVGPAGQRVRGQRAAERTAFNPNDQTVAALALSLTRGGAGEKIRSVDLAGVLVALLQQNANPANQRAAELLLDALRVAARDTNPSVAAWSASVVVLHSPEVDRAKLVTRMITEPQWPARLLGLASIKSLPAGLQKSLAKSAVADNDPLVAAFAHALLEGIEAVGSPASQPTSVPAATAPAAQ